MAGIFRHEHREILRACMVDAGFSSVGFIEHSVALVLALYANTSDFKLPEPVRERKPFEHRPAWHLHHVVVIDVGMGMTNMSLVRVDRGARTVEVRMWARLTWRPAAALAFTHPQLWLCGCGVHSYAPRPAARLASRMWSRHALQSWRAAWTQPTKSQARPHAWPRGGR